MKQSILLLLVLLAACTAPSPHFRGIDATRITVADSVFDVRVRGNLAEAVRVNAQYAPRFGPIRARAAFAITQVSGCSVKEVRGDQALALGLLDCGARSPDWRHRIVPVAYECSEIRSWQNPELRIGYSDFECTPL